MRQINSDSERSGSNAVNIHLGNTSQAMISVSYKHSCKAGMWRIKQDSQCPRIFGQNTSKSIQEG